MKVYVLTLAYEREEQVVLGVYSTEALAQEAGATSQARRRPADGPHAAQVGPLGCAGRPHVHEVDLDAEAKARYA
jgi:hypothetical protein